MNIEKIKIANLKCSGCENTIKSRLSEIPGTDKVLVDREDDSITLYFNDPATREDYTHKLHQLGYPEATEENGLLMQLKSYASCMIGRLTPDAE